MQIISYFLVITVQTSQNMLTYLILTDIVHQLTTWYKYTYSVHLLHLANLSSKQCSDRRTKLIEEIENVIAYSEDPEAFVEQKTIMDLLDLTEKDKNLLTRSITTAFPYCLKKTICTNNKKE